MSPVNWLNYVVPAIPAGDFTIDTDLTGWTIKNCPAQGHPTIRGSTQRDSWLGGGAGRCARPPFGVSTATQAMKLRPLLPGP